MELSKKSSWVMSWPMWSSGWVTISIESAITQRSGDELKLKKGDTVVAVVKATEVMIQKD